MSNDLSALFQSEPLRAALREKFTQGVFATDFDNRLKLECDENTLSAHVDRAVKELLASLDEQPWHKTLRFCVPEIMPGSFDHISMTDTEFKYVLEALVDGEENDELHMEALEALCPSLMSHPDSKTYVDGVIKPFRSFALMNIVGSVVDGVMKTAATDGDVTKRRAFMHLNAFTDSPNDVVETLKLCVKEDLEGIRKKKKTARHDGLLVFCEAFLTKDKETIQRLSNKGLSFALVVMAEFDFKDGKVEDAVSSLVKAATIGDPVAQYHLGAFCSAAVSKNRPIPSVVKPPRAKAWYEDCVDNNEWGLWMDLPWGSARGVQRLAAKEIETIEEAEKQSSKKHSGGKKGTRGGIGKCSAFGCVVVAMVVAHIITTYYPSPF
eukprot:PhM_4_TR4027/c0_g2_i1/m.47034